MRSTDILIIDMGSQYTLVIGRTLRELGFRSVIIPHTKAKLWLKHNKPKAIILSGGSASVYKENSPKPPKEILKIGVPILGICYGMQWLSIELGGKVVTSLDQKEYGKVKINLTAQGTRNKLFNKIIKASVVWASHGDSVEKIPNGFNILARSEDRKTITSIYHSKKKIWALQFHPEVTHTVFGKKILQNFIQDICQCDLNWQPRNIIKEIQTNVTDVVSEKNVIIGFSGGVDSTTLSAIVSPVLKNKLLAVCIDTGALRKNELIEIKKNAKAVGVKLKVIEASQQFLKAMKDLSDAEKKRGAFRKMYVSILEEEAKKHHAEFILQGSLATDYIESGKVGEATLIKSHHNIGNNWEMKEIHPLKDLFKYEVRDLAQSLKLPKTITNRQPFPGPGLYVRVIGGPPTKTNIKIVREADAIITKILQKRKIYNDISQLVVALLGIRTVGIKEDGRSYAHPIVIRTIKTEDYMTVSGVDLPVEVKNEIEKSITKHPKLNRVWFDTTDKPSGTIEFE